MLFEAKSQPMNSVDFVIRNNAEDTQQLVQSPIVL